VKQNIVNVLGMGKLVDRNAFVRSAATRKQEKILSHTRIVGVNVKNPDVLKSIANVFKMEKSVVHNANVRTVLMDWNNYKSEIK
jgi:hypothetical protein